MTQTHSHYGQIGKQNQHIVHVFGLWDEAHQAQGEQVNSTYTGTEERFNPSTLKVRGNSDLKKQNILR